MEKEKERERERKRERERERESRIFKKNKIGGCWTSKAMGTINDENIKQS